MPCTPLFLFPPYRPHHHPIAPTAQCEKNRPHHRFAPTARCEKNRPHHRFTPTAQCGETALIIGLRQRRDAGKTAEERFNMLARGWLAYPVTPIHSHLPPKSGYRNHIPRLANNLYNRSSAVDSLIHNQPQVGKPTWGYNYTTARRRLPHPSSTTSKNALTHRPPSPKTSSPIGHHPQKRTHPSATIPKNAARPSASTSKNAIRPSSAIPKNAIRPSAAIPKNRHPMVCANGAMRKKPPKSGFLC